MKAANAAKCSNLIFWLEFPDMTGNMAVWTSAVTLSGRQPRQAFQDFVQFDEIFIEIA